MPFFVYLQTKSRQKVIQINIYFEIGRKTTFAVDFKEFISLRESAFKDYRTTISGISLFTH